jgi:hypothetical protein
MRDRVLWHLKQLLPLTYRTWYAEQGVWHFTVWRMWLGRCFDITDVVPVNVPERYRRLTNGC